MRSWVAAPKVLRVRLTMPDGEVVEREWGMGDVETMGPPPSPLPWMRNPARSWENPQDPMELRADVLEGFEETARSWLAGLP